jgi:hypothetical protein
MKETIDILVNVPVGKISTPNGKVEVYGGCPGYLKPHYPPLLIVRENKQFRFQTIEIDGTAGTKRLEGLVKKNPVYCPGCSVHAMVNEFYQKSFPYEH